MNSHPFVLLFVTQVTPNELTNGVINSGFMLLFKDSIRLFACYNDGIINLLGKYIKSKCFFNFFKFDFLNIF